MARRQRTARDQRIGETVWDGDAANSSSRLLIGALESFAERGFHGTTTRDIASRAGLSPAAVYIHYHSKEELLYIIMRQTHDEILRRMKEASQANEVPIERVKALVFTHVVFHALRNTAARVANHELPALEPAHHVEIVNLRAKIEGILKRALLDGVASGDFQVEDIKATSFAILSLGIGVSRWFNPKGRLSPEVLGDQYAELVVRMIATLPRLKGHRAIEVRA